MPVVEAIGIGRRHPSNPFVPRGPETREERAVAEAQRAAVDAALEAGVEIARPDQLLRILAAARAAAQAEIDRATR